MVHNHLYGFHVESDFPLGPDLHSVGDADIVIRSEPVDLPEMQRSPRTGTLYQRSNDTLWLHWDSVGSFRIHAGREISAMPAPDVDEKVFQRILTGQAMALALYQRGRFILHASTVVDHGSAVAFAGDCGYGKSTLASSLHASGHYLVADDITSVQVGDKEHMVFPGNQEFKLWPDSVRNLGGNEDSLHRFHPKVEKRLLPATERLQREPVPLKLVYMLGFDDHPSIESMTPAQAAIELVRNTYGITLLHEIRTVDYFQQIVRIAQSVPVVWLRRERTLENFDRFLAMVEEDMAKRLDDSASA